MESAPRGREQCSLISKRGEHVYPVLPPGYAPEYIASFIKSAIRREFLMQLHDKCPIAAPGPVPVTWAGTGTGCQNGRFTKKTDGAAVLPVSLKWL